MNILKELEDIRKYFDISKWRLKSDEEIWITQETSMKIAQKIEAIIKAIKE